ncbi:MAG: hypothetical protein HY247_05350 [archaeon]|nr:MAG: hypothetical protein HY247_05350 [archaeon]
MLGGEPSGRSRRWLGAIGRGVVAAVLLGLFSAGYWALNQTLDSVTILHRAFVDLPFSPWRLDVWTYHDVAFTLLWVSYVGFALWEALPWRFAQHHVARAAIALFGFSVLTAGLWLAQDLMNAVLVLRRGYVDFPFFLSRPDLLATRDIVELLVPAGFLSLFALNRVAGLVPRDQQSRPGA